MYLYRLLYKMLRLKNSYIRKILLAFIFIFTTIIFSLFNIFTLIVTCSKYYCYYKKCQNYKYNFDNKMKCFFDKTDDLLDWSILNIFSLGIYFTLIMSVLITKIFYKKVKHYFISYKNINIDNNLNIIFEPRCTEIDIDNNLGEELESEERDTLLNVSKNSII